MAFRSTATALVALIAAYVVQSKALPALTREMSELGNDSPAAVSWLMGLRGWLIVVPLPGLVLGIAAIALRRLRPILSPLAALASLAAVVALVATLAASLAAGLGMENGMRLANCAAGIVVSKLGTAAAEPSEIRDAAERYGVELLPWGG